MLVEPGGLPGAQTEIEERKRKMRFRKMGLALLACMAVAAVSANAAQASWTTETSGHTLGATPAEVEMNGENMSLESTLLGQTIVLHAGAVGCQSESVCQIEESNKASGALEFTSVTVEPATCSVAGGAIPTNALKAEVEMVGTGVFMNFAPESGSVFAEFELEGEECPLAEVLVQVKGEVAGKSENLTGELATDQPLTFNAAEQEESGSTLHIGKNTAAILTGVVHNEIGTKFGADE